MEVGAPQGRVGVDSGLDVKTLVDLDCYKFWEDCKDPAPTTLLLYYPRELKGVPYAGDKAPDEEEGAVGGAPRRRPSAAAGSASSTAGPVPDAGQAYLLPKPDAKKILKGVEGASRVLRKQMGLPIPKGMSGDVVHPTIQEGDKVCPECKAACGSTRALKRHMKIHTGDTKHCCKDCNRYFATNKALVEHLAAHTEEGKIVCPRGCTAKRTGLPISFSNAKKLKVHMRHYHADKEPSLEERSCPFCKRDYPTVKLMQSHRTSCPKDPNKERYSCMVEDCELSYSRRRDMLRHMRVKHPDAQ